LQTTVATVKGGTATPYGNTLTLPVMVSTATQTGTEAVAALQAFTLATSKEQKLRDSLVTQLQGAMGLFQQNTAAGYESAIARLMAVIDQLGGLSVDTRAIHDGVGKILKQAQWGWSGAPAAGKK
jgi:hypothetical protein